MRFYLTGLQIVTPFLAVFGFFLMPSFTGLVVSLALFALMGGLGMRLTYHMAVAHRVPMHPMLRRLGLVMGYLGSHMSPVGWALRHSNHHRFVDRPGDPHCPRLLGWKAAFFVFHEDTVAAPLMTAGRLYKDPEVIFMHRFGFAFVALHLAVCLWCGFAGLVYGFTFPVALTLWGQIAAIFNHGPDGPINRGWINAAVTMGEHTHADHHGDVR